MTPKENEEALSYMSYMDNKSNDLLSTRIRELSALQMELDRAKLQYDFYIGRIKDFEQELEDLEKIQ